MDRSRHFVCLSPGGFKVGNSTGSVFIAPGNLAQATACTKNTVRVTRMPDPPAYKAYDVAIACQIYVLVHETRSRLQVRQMDEIMIITLTEFHGFSPHIMAVISLVWS